MAKRKVFIVESMDGNSAIAYSFNSALVKGVELMKEFSRSCGLAGNWRQIKSVNYGERYALTGANRAWAHDDTGTVFSFATRIQEPKQ
jgi:hypothetical protein